MLAVPAFQARTQTALIRANNKPPLEVVVANLENVEGFTGVVGGPHFFMSGDC